MVVICYSSHRKPIQTLSIMKMRDFSGDLAKLHAPNAEGLGSIPGQGTRSDMPQLRVHIPQLKVPHTATRMEDPTCYNKDLAKPNK